ncbi:MAG: flagellar assembly protein FliH, partial [Sulfuriferula sp.]
PKEQLTAYQRWEMADFDESTPPIRNASAPSAAEITAITDLARREGYTKGLAEGFQTGHNDGLATALAEGQAQTDEIIQQLTALMTGLNAEIATANQTIANDLLALAMDIAQAMLRTALPVKPDLILPIINTAIRDLPSLQQDARILLNPSDAALVKRYLHDDHPHWRVLEDNQIEAGGCRIETNSNQIDASMQGRWQRIAQSLGTDSLWLSSDSLPAADKK